MRILVDGLSMQIGGVGSLIMNFMEVKLLSRSYDDYEFNFIIYENSDYIPILDKLNLKYFIVPEFGRHPLKYKKYLKNHFKSEKYDFVWINETSKINFYLPKLSKKICGAKVILHSHGVKNEETGLRKLIFNVIDFKNYHKFMKIADYKFACSNLSADYFYRKNSKYRKDVYIIRNSISLDKYKFNTLSRNDYRNRLNLRDDDISLAIVGRLTLVKNQQFAVKLLSKLPEKYKLFLFGDGEDKEKLQKVCKLLNVADRVNFMGNVNNMFDYYNAMDILLMPSFSEGMPFSAIEAQASGLPIFISKGITSEINITSHVKYLPLNEEEWISQISNALPHNRLDDFVILKNNGFDTKDSFVRFISILSGEIK